MRHKGSVENSCGRLSVFVFYQVASCKNNKKLAKTTVSVSWRMEFALAVFQKVEATVRQLSVEWVSYTWVLGNERDS